MYLLCGEVNDEIYFKKIQKRQKEKHFVHDRWNSFQEVRKELFSYWLQKLVLILQENSIGYFMKFFYLLSLFILYE